VARLVNPDTGKDFARLEAPVQALFGGLWFTPDGTQLVAAGSQSKAIHIWDLRAIRPQLAVLGLEWNLPPYPPARTTKSRTEPFQVTVVHKPRRD
jgi:hypothetical protein